MIHLTEEEIKDLNGTIDEAASQAGTYLAEAISSCEDSSEVLTQGFSKGTFGEHELLDRNYCQTLAVEDLCLNHPATALNLDVQRWLSLALHCLVEAYMHVHKNEDSDETTVEAV